MGWRETVAALLGISAYAAPAPGTPSLGDAQIESVRAAYGGQIQPIPLSQTRWYMRDLEAAEHAADSGDLSIAARLMRSARKDGVYAGVLSTRTGGMVRLPKRFRGAAKQVAALERGHGSRSVFDEMFPAAELALLAADGIELGVGVGEMSPVAGREHPVLVRLDPEFLVFRWTENRWYYRSIAGLVAITPGDGRWILHVPGGRMAPWQHGLWRAIGRACIRKEYASSYKDHWENKLAHPARVATVPAGASDLHHESWFRQVMAWGINTVFAMKPGYDVKIVESNGRGYESFNKTIAEQNNEIVISVAGQTVTTTGGAGFQNSDVHKSIRADLIKETADGLSYTINTQGIPPWAVTLFGEDALGDLAFVEWDVTPPADRNREATALVSVANAIKGLTAALAAHGKKPNIEALCTQFGLQIDDLSPAEVTALEGAAANGDGGLAIVREAA